MKNANVLVMVTPMSPPRLNGIVKYAREQGWRLTFSDRLARQAADWRGDGVIATVRAEGYTADCVRRFRSHGIPVVDLTIEQPRLKLPRVIADHRGIGEAAARHFLERGFIRFAWFSTSWTHVHELRLDGFTSVISAAGRPDPETWILARDIPPEKMDDGRHFARWLAGRLRAAPKPIAICAYDDADAARVLNACNFAGVAVPENAAVLGIGNETMIAEHQPTTISSVIQDLEAGGYEGARVLGLIMDGKRVPQRIVLPHGGVIIRRSTDTLAAEDPLLRKALFYIRDNLMRSFGVEQVSDALGVPRAQLTALFQSELHHSLIAETMNQRILAAKNLLAGTDLPIAEIAERCGFCNAGYLSNAFRDAIGVSPRVWRKQTSATRSA